MQTMEGDVLEINQEEGKVKLRLTIIGRPMDVELEFWQVEKV
jgi:transcription antitermination factor NusG